MDIGVHHVSKGVKYHSNVSTILNNQTHDEYLCTLMMPGGLCSEQTDPFPVGFRETGQVFRRYIRQCQPRGGVALIISPAARQPPQHQHIHKTGHALNVGKLFITAEEIGTKELFQIM